MVLRTVHRPILLLLAFTVIAALAAVGARAWALSRGDVRPIGDAPQASPLLLRSGGPVHVILDGDCAGPFTPTAAWRLGPALSFATDTRTPGRPVPGDRLTRVLERAIGAFGERPGPCGRGPYGAWAVTSTEAAPPAGMVTTDRGVECGAADGASVVEWGVLPGARLGLTCVHSKWDRDGVLRVVEADIRLDESETWVGGVRDCEDAFVLESVQVHELGHVVGLPGRSTSSMEGAMQPCDDTARTLTGSDLMALEALVGR